MYISDFIAALCAVATTIRIEIPGGAMVHLGSAALFTSSILFGGLYGGLEVARKRPFPPIDETSR